jgi:V8-like Glu-specific endopeptidase
MSKKLMGIGLAIVATLAVSLPASAETPKKSLGGGSSIVFGHGDVTADHAGSCTLTTIGYDLTGDLVGLTNAHCFYDNDGHQWLGDKIYLDKAPPGTSTAPLQQIIPDLDTGVVGTVVYISGGNPAFPGPNGVGLDYSVIKFDKSKIAPTATVGDTTITSIGPAPGAGTIICKQGRTTGITCGTKIADIGNYFTHTIWEMPGDSGSPVTSGTTLIGNQWIAGGSVSMVAIMSDLNERGQIGAGFEPAA